MLQQTYIYIQYNECYSLTIYGNIMFQQNTVNALWCDKWLFGWVVTDLKVFIN